MSVLVSGILVDCFTVNILYGVMPMRKQFLVSLQLVVYTLRRPVKYGWGRHTTIVYPRFELRLLVNRGGTRSVDIVASQATCLLPARNAKYVRLYPSTRIAQPCGNPVNGQHHYSPQFRDLWARTLTQGTQFTERVHLKIVQRIHVGITQLD